MTHPPTIRNSRLSGPRPRSLYRGGGPVLIHPPPPAPRPLAARLPPLCCAEGSCQSGSCPHYSAQRGGGRQNRKFIRPAAAGGAHPTHMHLVYCTGRGPHRLATRAHPRHLSSCTRRDGSRPTSSLRCVRFPPPAGSARASPGDCSVQSLPHPFRMLQGCESRFRCVSKPGIGNCSRKNGGQKCTQLTPQKPARSPPESDSRQATARFFLLIALQRENEQMFSNVIRKVGNETCTADTPGATQSTASDVK